MKRFAMLAALIAALIFAPQTQAQEPQPQDDEPVFVDKVDGGDGSGAGGFAFRARVRFFAPRRVIVQQAFLVPAPILVQTQPVLSFNTYASYGSVRSFRSFSAGFSVGCGY